MSQAEEDSNPQAAVSAEAAEFVNPLIVSQCPADTLHACADVFDLIGEAGSSGELTSEARNGLHRITMVAAAALRFEAERVQYERKGDGKAAGEALQ